MLTLGEDPEGLQFCLAKASPSVASCRASLRFLLQGGVYIGLQEPKTFPCHK